MSKLGKITITEILPPRASGILVVLWNLARRLGIIELLDRLLAWDPEQCRLSPAQRIFALAISLLFDRTALYRMWEVFEAQDLEVVFGPGITPEAFNDAALGRALDKLAEGGAPVFLQLCHKVLTTLGVPYRRLHVDTSSFSVEGAYEEQEPGYVRIEHGYSKDKRPDLKQFIIGLATTEHGLPVGAMIEDGSTQDKKWQQLVLRATAKMAPPELMENLLYVADSAMVTEKSLKQTEGTGLKFVTRLPETYKAAAEAKARARQAPEAWQEIGALSSRPEAARYRVQEQEVVLYGRTYRALVVHSDHGAQRDKRAWTKQVEREPEQLQAAAQDLEKQAFACREDAERAYAAWLRTTRPRFWAPQAAFAEEQVPVKRPHAGRPRKGEEAPAPVTRWRVHVDVTLPNETARSQAQEDFGLFVLITNDRTRTAREILEVYKGQTSTVEMGFRTLKDIPVAPVFLKKNSRIEALAWVALIAYLLYAVLQYVVREELRKRGEKLLIPGKRWSENPTGRMLLDMLRKILTARVVLEDGSIYRQASGNGWSKRVVELLGFDWSIFTTVPEPR